MPEELWVLWPWMHLAGRVLFSLFFIVFGLMHLFQLRRIAQSFETKRVPGPAPVALVTGLLILTGGVLVLLGWSRFVGAGLLFIVLFPGAFALHPFWKETDPQVRLREMAGFFMTLGLAGAALFVAFYGYQEWPMALG